MTKAATPGPAPEVVAEFRQAAGLTQREAAAMVHVTGPAWARWESLDPKLHRSMPYGLFELFSIKAKALKT